MSNPSTEKIAAEMRKIFGSDLRRIGHAMSVLSFAQKILLKEPGDPDVVIAAALLHDIGIHEAENKHNSTAGKYQEIEGPPIARRILEFLGADPETVSEVCDIISHHHSPGKEETLNFRILYDADMLVNLCDDVPLSERIRLKGGVQRIFLTETGMETALETLFE